MKTNINTLNCTLSGVVCAGALVLAANVSAQNLFVSDYGAQNVYEYSPGQSTIGSGMSYPYGLAFDPAGDLFIANSANNNGESGNITEIMPDGTQSTFYSGVDPIALAFYGGNLYEADYNSGNIYEYTPGHVQSTFASGFNGPLSLAFDSSGDLFVGSGYNGGSGIITKIAPDKTQSPFASGLDYPGGLTFDGPNLLVTEQDSGTIFSYTPGGAQSIFANTASTSLNGLAFDSSGDLFVCDTAGSIIEIAPGGGQGTFASGLGIPAGIAFQPVPRHGKHRHRGIFRASPNLLGQELNDSF